MILVRQICWRDVRRQVSDMLADGFCHFSMIPRIMTVTGLASTNFSKGPLSNILVSFC